MTLMNLSIKVIKGSPGNTFVKASQEKVRVETSNTELLVKRDHIDRHR